MNLTNTPAVKINKRCYFTKEANPSSNKPPLTFSDGLSNLELTSIVKMAIASVEEQNLYLHISVSSTGGISAFAYQLRDKWACSQCNRIYIYERPPAIYLNGIAGCHDNYFWQFNWPPPPPPPPMPRISVRESDQHWFRQWLGAYSAPSHYLNQCWVIVNWTLRNKLQWIFSPKSNFFIQETAFEDVVCQLATILSWGRINVRKFWHPPCSFTD